VNVLYFVVFAVQKYTWNKKKNKTKSLEIYHHEKHGCLCSNEY